MKRTLAALLLLSACGGNKGQKMPSSWANFECNDRKVSYFVVGGMAAQEAGVAMSCAAPDGPHVERYAVDTDGARTEASMAISPGEFNDVWTRIDATGWHNLDDCAPDVGSDVPVYQFDVADYSGNKTIGCDALRPDFPYNTFIDELDQLAAQIEGSDGANQMDLDDSDIDLKN